MIKRIVEKNILEKLKTGKAIIILGPRQTGKTTLVKKVLDGLGDYCFLNCDNTSVKTQLEQANTQKLRQIIGKHKIVFVDEAQRVKDIGLTLKLITDEMPEVQLFVSGSSSLELLSEISEPLTGRKWEYMLFPISWQELTDHIGFLDAKMQLENRLIFGMYPEVITNQGDEKDVLIQLTSSYLYKDLLEYKGIRKPDLIIKLLQALAFQVSSEVSFNELANLLGVDKNTIYTYIDLLEKAFIIFRLYPFKRNLRNEISTSRKIYFYDNGIRNSLIANFNPIALRQDKGALWENFLISERMKYLNYNKIWTNKYFWRTHAQQEIDYIEDKDGKLYTYEFKWNPKKTVKLPRSFSVAYPNSEYEIVNAENFDRFLLSQ
ncbi:MAG: ATPase [Bacteroidetes bacterium 4484_276]|nr:MAG: ATPase [Bacteroidetes bacterium 4484_276]